MSGLFSDDPFTERAPAPSSARPARAPDPQAQIVCPHCQMRGKVTARRVKRDKRLSATRLLGGMLTAGASVAAVGVTKKHPVVTAMHCRNCGMRWDVA